MAGSAIVLACVFVGRIIAAAGPTALLTSAQMNPAGTDFHAIFADALLRLLDRLDCLDVGAGICHLNPLVKEYAHYTQPENLPIMLERNGSQ